MLRRLPRYPLLWAVIGWHVVWGAIALVTDAGPLIEFLNGLLLAVGSGVLVAFFTIMVHALRAERPTSDQILIAGIWWSWLATVEQRVWSIVWRALGAPMALANTDLVTHFVSIMLLAGLMHMAGPEAINGRVPTRQWARIGAYVACGIAIFVCLAWFGLVLRED